MGKWNRRLREKATQAFALPEDVLLHLPVVHLVGGQRLDMENHRGLVEYTSECIRVRTTLGETVIRGKELLLKEIGPEDLMVLGTIEGLETRLK